LRRRFAANSIELLEGKRVRHCGTIRSGEIPSNSVTQAHVGPPHQRALPYPIFHSERGARNPPCPSRASKRWISPKGCQQGLRRQSAAREASRKPRHGKVGKEQNLGLFNYEVLKGMFEVNCEVRSFLCRQKADRNRPCVRTAVVQWARSAPAIFR